MVWEASRIENLVFTQVIARGGNLCSKDTAGGRSLVFSLLLGSATVFVTGTQLRGEKDFRPRPIFARGISL